MYNDLVDGFNSVQTLKVVCVFVARHRQRTASSQDHKGKSANMHQCKNQTPQANQSYNNSSGLLFDGFSSILS